MSKDSDLKKLVDWLADFTLEVRKKNGSRYPPGTIQGTMRGVNRLIRARQEERVIERDISIVHMDIFKDIFKDPLFRKVKVAGDIAVQKSLDAGLGKFVQKSDPLSVGEEQKMLSLPINQINSLLGINHRFAWYYTKNFLIRGASEFRQVCVEDFTLHNRYREMLRYTPGTSKNWKVDILHCSSEQLRRPVEVQILDVIAMFRKLISKRLKFGNNECGPFPLFLKPRLKCSSSDSIWFHKGVVGKNTLSNYTRAMTVEITELEGKVITNKTGRNTAISRLESALTLVEFGMEVSGHRNPGNYRKYSTTNAEVRSRAMQRIIDGEDVTFGEAYEQEIEVERVARDLSETPGRKRKQNVDLDEEHAFWDRVDVIHDLEDDLKKYEKQSKVVHQNNSMSSISGHAFKDLTNCTINIINVIDPAQLGSFKSFVGVQVLGQENTAPAK
ncbi:unnamed protein product [Calypogeia fissa]